MLAHGPCTATRPYTCFTFTRSARRPAFENAQAHLDRLVTANLADVIVEAVAIRHGLPEETIVAYAKEYAVDPIVLGRRQRSTIERIHVGSTTSAVISLATGPVLIVPIDFSENLS